MRDIHELENLLPWRIKKTRAYTILSATLPNHTTAAPQRAVAVVYPDGGYQLSLRIFPAPERRLSLDELTSIVEKQRSQVCASDLQNQELGVSIGVSV